MELSTAQTWTSLVILLTVADLSKCFVVAWKPPVILHKSEKLTLLEGDKLELVCEGDSAVKWDQALATPDEDELLSSSVTTARRKHSATLTMSRLTVQDTGKYICRYKSPQLSELKDAIDVLVIKKKGEEGKRLISKAVLASIIITCGILFIGLIALRFYRKKITNICNKCLFPGTDDADSPEHKPWIPDPENDRNKENVEVNDIDLNGLQGAKQVIEIDASWEFPREKLILGRELGAGAFGRVVKAQAIGLLDTEPTSAVAVKMLKPEVDESQVKALVMELKVMANLGRHVNIVNFIGACTNDQACGGELMVIVEYCDQGNLLNYIRNRKNNFVNQLPLEELRNSTCRESTNSAYEKRSSYEDESEEGDKRGSTLADSQPMTTSDLLCWSYQVAKGMEYLASRKVIHGDLAARNVLLTKDNIIKLCDFGLSKELYKDYNYVMSTKSGKFPIKWMAIESIYYGELSSESDCWSFGILLWELFSLGKVPYPGVKADENLIKRIEHGYRLSKPEYASQEMYSIMRECWSEEKSKRPKFPRLVSSIRVMLDQSTCEKLEEQNAEYENMYGSLENPSQDGHPYKILSKCNRQELDTSGYLRPIQVSSRAISKPEENLELLRSQSRNNSYVKDPTLSMPVAAAEWTINV